jgi:hypothetical protein
MLFLGVGLLFGLALTPFRKQLLSPWSWCGAAIALLVVSPNLLWQLQNGWPTLEFLNNVRLYKNYPVSPFEFIAMQFAVVHPLVFPMGVAGLCHCLFFVDRRRYRSLGWMYLGVFATFMMLRAKFYYLFPIYPMLLAAGAVAVEQFVAQRRTWLRPVMVAALVVGGAITLPYAVPILPIDAFMTYDDVLKIDNVIRFEKWRRRNQHVVYADMFGWPEMVEKVAQVHARLPVSDRARCTVLTANYGEAGALDFFGRAYGLPQTVSAHNSYYLWGPGPSSWEVVIAVGFDRTTLESLFKDVLLAETSQNEYARESEVDIHVCRDMKLAVGDVWRRLKLYR